MTNTQVGHKFYAELARGAASASGAPVNTSALLRDKDLALQKAASLHGYQTFLTQARSWKAARKSVPRSFEREVQVHAAQALADGRELAAATLRSTRHLKHAGQLDQVLDSWIAGVKASGPVQLQDLWSDILNDPEARQGLREQGLADDLFASINENMQKLEGRLLHQGGKLVGEVKLAGRDRTQRVVLAHSVSGSPRTLHDLLIGGHFERIVEQFEQKGAMSFDLVGGQPREVEITDVVAAGAIFSLQTLAQHKRKLEDTGLAAVAGNDPVTVIGLVGLFLAAIALLGMAVFCSDGNETACKVSAVLFILSFLLTVGLVAGLTGNLDLAAVFLAPFVLAVLTDVLNRRLGGGQQ
jgi:hypothetical protein